MRIVFIHPSFLKSKWEGIRSIKLLEENGIFPDFILCRGKKALDNVRKKKIETYANIKADNVISMPDVIGEGTANTIYVIPLDLEKEELGNKLKEKQKKEMSQHSLHLLL